MIFVTLGTQDKPFVRLLDAVEKQIELGNIKEKVIAQVGSTKYKSNKMEIIEYMTSEEISKNIEKANIIISHAGVGSIIECVKKNKKVIAAARLKEYGEHVNNHQQQILESYNENGYILKLDNFEELGNVLEYAKTFIPKQLENNNENFINELKKEISKLL